MWIRCKCGNIIHDNTDSIPYKGHIISDKEYFKMLELADELIESPVKNREALVMTFRNNIGAKSYIRIKSIFQCTCCGRLLLEDENNQYFSFTPDGNEKKDLLDFSGSETIDYM
ncbi:MAG: hypothetical protein SPE43_03360 [Ruminococcus sp.]|nr:hypothetical protein [Ruminococcus sp.]